MKKCIIVLKEGMGLAKKEYIGDFYGIFQISQIVSPSPFIDGHKGGVLADVVAVVDVGQGPRKFYIEDITKIYDKETQDESKQDEIKKNCCENCEKCKEKKSAEEGIARLHCIINKEGLLERCEELQ